MYGAGRASALALLLACAAGGLTVATSQEPTAVPPSSPAAPVPRPPAAPATTPASPVIISSPSEKASPPPNTIVPSGPAISVFF